MGLLDGRVAIVTGASRGIGAEIARRFGAEGAAVAVSARTTDPGSSPFSGTINETAEQIRAQGGTAIAVGANLAKPEDRERLVSETAAQLGTPDILVNNAAVTYFRRIENVTPKQYALIFDVQVVASVHLATLVLPGMRERGAGWIPNKVVPTPGTLFHHLTTEDNPNSEPPSVMAAAALALCTADPKTRTGRIAYSIDLLTELGEPIPPR